MLRLTSSARFRAIAPLLAVFALAAPEAGHGHSVRAATCSFISPAEVETYAEFSNVIVIGRVTEVTDRYVELQPEAYLKGTASNERVRLIANGPVVYDDCAQARFLTEERVALFLEAHTWPNPSVVYRLADGRVTNVDYEASEEAFIARVRGVTGQYSVPAATSSDSAGVDWTSTVIPVAGVILIIFVVGLFLMRIWHRIDPS